MLHNGGSMYATLHEINLQKEDSSIGGQHMINKIFKLKAEILRY